jgi:hypothetical protein
VQPTYFTVGRAAYTGNRCAHGTGGTAIGIVADLGLTRPMASMLFGVKPTDPITFGGFAVVLCGIALLAGLCAGAARGQGRSHGGAAIRVIAHKYLSMILMQPWP